MGESALSRISATEHECSPFTSITSLEQHLSTSSSEFTRWSQKCSQEGSFRSGLSLSESIQVFRSLTASCWIRPSQLILQTSGKKLGEGGFASVTKALLSCQGSAPQVVAVKQLSESAVRDNPGTSLKDFLWEASVLSQMKHRCITELIGVGGFDSADADVEEGHLAEKLYVVQEYLDGGDLRKLLIKQMMNPHRRLYRRCDALRWALQVARGLCYLHNCAPAVIHRDLKPDNIGLLGSNLSCANAKILDFGLHALVTGACVRNLQDEKLATVWSDDVRAMEDVSMHGVHAFTALTAFGAPASTLSRYQLTGNMGSYPYMAPEVFKCQPYDEKVDVYSFGMILYELLTYELQLRALVARGKVEEEVHYVESLAEGWRPPIPAYIPDPLSQLISSCWAQYPGNRPSMKRVVTTLRAYAEKQGWNLSACEHVKAGRSGGVRAGDDTMEGPHWCGCKVM